MLCHERARCSPQSAGRETWARNDIGYKAGFTVWPRRSNSRYFPDARDSRDTSFHRSKINPLIEGTAVVRPNAQW